MRAIQCLIISIFAILSASGTAPWGGYLGKYLLQRPFIGGLICGIVFGDITQGILIGAAMQLVYIGYFNVGGVQSIDMGIISFPCVAIAMMSGIDTSAAIALATGLGALFTTLEMLCRTVFFPSAGALMKKGCEEADDRKIFLGYWVIPTGVYILTRGATSFLLDLATHSTTMVCRSSPGLKVSVMFSFLAAFAEVFGSRMFRIMARIS